MSISYHVYKNATSGGPVDYSSPIATTASLSYLTAVLAFPFVHWFAVRAFDTITGFEDLNTDARVRLVLDAAGANITNRPASPTGLSAVATANGGVRVEWAFSPESGATPPTGFKVWVQAGVSIDYTLTPDATATYSADSVAYSADVAGLADATLYTVAVRAANATGDDPNTDTTTVTADATGPLPVASLSGAPTY